MRASGGSLCSLWHGVQVFDSSWICERGEMVSFVQLQKRAMKLNHVLMGWYELPGLTANPLQLEVNPQSAEVRLEKRVWNLGTLHPSISQNFYRNACSILDIACTHLVEFYLPICGGGACCHR